MANLNENIYRSVDELEVAVRTALYLQQADILYIGELVQKTEAQLVELNFGKRAISELRDILAEMGFQLGTKLDDWPGREALQQK